MNGGLESAVNLGRRCIQDFYLPRYFILENVRNFVSPAADDDGGFPPSLPPSHHGGTRSSLVWRQILQPDIKVIGAADGQSTTTLALIIRRSASLGHQRASDQISVLLDLGAATAATAASFCLSRQGNS